MENGLLKIQEGEWVGIAARLPGVAGRINAQAVVHVTRRTPTQIVTTGNRRFRIADGKEINTVLVPRYAFALTDELRARIDEEKAMQVRQVEINDRFERVRRAVNNIGLSLEQKEALVLAFEKVRPDVR